MSQLQPAPQGVDYPGKTLGIVGLVLVLVGVVTAAVPTIVGLILSHIGLSQSSKAGYQNGPAKAGVIVGWIVIGLAVLAVILVLLLVPAFVISAVQTR